ncbi:unnamed protein product [Aphanomyces euteiches]
MGQNVSGPRVPDSESRALHDLFTALRNKPHRLVRSSLPLQTNVQPVTHDWTGISVEMGHVVAIELPKSNLHGELPASIEQLTYLRVLNLSSNEIHGEIPPALGKLRRLTVLDLSCNNLKGALPEEITNCIHLKHLSLQQNALHGPLPTSLGKLQRLKSLSLEFNSFSGPLPESITDLASLERLNVRSNCLNGAIPADIGRLGQLKFVSLRNNALRGTCVISTAMVQQCNLGSIPESFGQCALLSFLNLSSNNLTGYQLPCANLKHLYLFGNALAFNAIPEELQPLVQLQERDIRLQKLHQSGVDGAAVYLRHGSLVSRHHEARELAPRPDKQDTATAV